MTNLSLATGTASQPSPKATPDVGRAPADASRPGRKRDHSRDRQILDAALDVLAETGYDGMTIEAVAARAKAGKATLYRRWPSKDELVIEAVACMKATDVDEEQLPDTGTLRGDLVAMIRPQSIEEGTRKLKVMAGLISMLSRKPELAQMAHQAIVEPRAGANRVLIRRAMDRGDIPADRDVDALALILPSMSAYRVLMLQLPVDRDFLVSLIDNVLLPAVGGTR